MKRYAIYYAPEPGGFADAAAAWLGWDPVRGRRSAQAPDLAAMTADPRRYGFHGTIKPPFRLAPGRDLAGLQTAVQNLAASLAPVQMPGLDLTDLHGFLALVPQVDLQPLSDLAAKVVIELDPFRAALNPAEIARRRPDRLSARQRHLLDLYGYPGVLDQFQFHLTLSSKLTDPLRQDLVPRAAAHFAPHLPRPFRITELALFGEDQAGWFHLLQRYPLSG